MAASRISLLRIRNWKALERAEWLRLIEEAKTHTVVYRHEFMYVYYNVMPLQVIYPVNK